MDNNPSYCPPQFRAYLDLFFKVSLLLFVVSMCCELVKPAYVQSTTPSFDLNAKLGKLHTLGSSSFGLGIQALQNEEPPAFSIDNIRDRKLAFQGQLQQPVSNQRPNPFYSQSFSFKSTI